MPLYFRLYTIFHLNIVRKAALLEVKNIFGDLPVLETERLILRAMRADDAQDLFKLYSDSKLSRFMPLAADVSVEGTKKRVAWYLEQYRTEKPAGWVIVDKKDNKVIGVIGFFRWESELGSAEIARMLVRKYWRRGLMTEDTVSVISCAFEDMGLNRIESYTHLDNKATIGLNKKLGFAYEEHRREYKYYRRAYWDTLIFSLLRNDWLTNR